MNPFPKKILLFVLFGLTVVPLHAVEISLDALTPIRIGYVDLQKVFDVYPEKAFAEGDLLKEIQKRKRTLSERQAEINGLRQQLTVDQAALDDARAGRPVMVPHNALAPEPAAPPVTPKPVPSVTASSGTAISSATVVQPYPTEEPLNTLLNSSGTTPTSSATPPQTNADPLESLAMSSAPVVMDAEMMPLLQKRIQDNRRALERAVLNFRDYRSKALDDMKILQKEKTYDVMSKIYAVLESLAHDEGVTVVFDKAYVLYGEDSVDLSDKLIQRLGQPTP